MLEFIRSIYGRPTPLNPERWHHWHTFLPVRLIDGTWSMSPVWRRKTDAGWEYSQMEQSEEDWRAEQW